MAVIILKNTAQIIHTIFTPVLNPLLFTSTSYITQTAHINATSPIIVPILIPPRLYFFGMNYRRHRLVCQEYLGRTACCNKDFRKKIIYDLKSII